MVPHLNRDISPKRHWIPNYGVGAARDDGDAGPGAVAAMLLKFPAEMRAIQRRKSFRVPVAGVVDLEVKMWTMPEAAHLRDKPALGREIACEPRDISVGGIGLTIRATNGRPPNRPAALGPQRFPARLASPIRSGDANSLMARTSVMTDQGGRGL